MTRALKMTLLLPSKVTIVAWFTESRLALEWLSELPNDADIEGLSLVWEDYYEPRDVDKDAS